MLSGSKIGPLVSAKTEKQWVAETHYSVSVKGNLMIVL